MIICLITSRFGFSFPFEFGTAYEAVNDNTDGTELGTAVNHNYFMNLPLSCSYQEHLDVKFHHFFALILAYPLIHMRLEFSSVEFRVVSTDICAVLA